MTQPCCGFLTAAELEQLIDGRLPLRRVGEWQRHAAQCGRCALLSADADTYGELTAAGPSADELEQARNRREFVLAAARRAIAPQRRGTSYRGWIGLAASFAIGAIALGTWLRTPIDVSIALPGGTTIRREAPAYSEPPALRGGASSAGWQAAGTAFRAARWNEAAELFARLAADQEESPDPDYYAGVSYYMAGRYEAARDALTRARTIAETQALPSAAIDWHRALACFALGDDRTARVSLQHAARAEGEFALKARELLARLP